MLSIEKRVKRVIRQYKMIGPNDKIGVALSGGADSVTALHLLNMITGPRRDVELVEIYIDEGAQARKGRGLRSLRHYQALAAQQVGARARPDKALHRHKPQGRG